MTTRQCNLHDNNMLIILSVFEIPIALNVWFTQFTSLMGNIWMFLKKKHVNTNCGFRNICEFFLIPDQRSPTGGPQENCQWFAEKFEYRNFQFYFINLAAGSRLKIIMHERLILKRFSSVL